jgi:hypothetical protein
MFECTKSEYDELLRCQNGTLKGGRGEHQKYLPYVFTEQGIAMLSSVLSSKKAVHVNIQIMRAFIHIRKNISINNNIENELNTIKKKLNQHDVDIKAIIAIIDRMMKEENTEKRKTGF